MFIHTYVYIGMKPLIFSSKSKRGWTRTGANIQYYYSANNNNNTNGTDTLCSYIFIYINIYI
jgi:hypothetical protein